MLVPTSRRSFGKLLTAAVLSAALLLTGCFGHSRGYGRDHGGNALAWIGAAIVTAAIISSIAPPPPQVVYVPEPRPGWTWQPGYWTREGDDWAWIDGRWIQLPRDYQWAPTHWEQAPDGNWELVPGRWVANGPR